VKHPPMPPSFEQVPYPPAREMIVIGMKVVVAHGAISTISSNSSSAELPCPPSGGTAALESSRLRPYSKHEGSIDGRCLTCWRSVTVYPDSIGTAALVICWLLSSSPPAAAFPLHSSTPTFWLNNRRRTGGNRLSFGLRRRPIRPPHYPAIPVICPLRVAVVPRAGQVLARVARCARRRRRLTRPAPASLPWVSLPPLLLQLSFRNNRWRIRNIWVAPP
jgi:hypothetical protein